MAMMPTGRKKSEKAQLSSMSHDELMRLCAEVEQVALSNRGKKGCNSKQAQKPTKKPESKVKVETDGAMLEMFLRALAEDTVHDLAQKARKG